MTRDRMTHVKLMLHDEAASERLGAALADLVVAGFSGRLPPAFDGFTIHLSGALGAGKTTLVRALLRRLGVEGRIKSPTYTLVESYVVEMPTSSDAALESRQRTKLDCYHFDFYRFEDPHAWLDAGFRDNFSDAALRLVEWPERAVGGDGSLLPAPDLSIALESAEPGLSVALESAEPGRIATLASHTDRGAAWLTSGMTRFALAIESPPDDDASSRAD